MRLSPSSEITEVNGVISNSIGCRIPTADVSIQEITTIWQSIIQYSQLMCNSVLTNQQHQLLCGYTASTECYGLKQGFRDIFSKSLASMSDTPCERSLCA